MPTAFEWLDSLVSRQALASSRAKDVKTALRRLADAVGVTIDALDVSKIEATYLQTLKTYFAEHVPPASDATTRNTVQNLKQFYRLLHITGILTPSHPHRSRDGSSQTASRDESQLTSPYRTRSMLPKYRLPPTQWPPAIRDAWERYCAERAFDIRPVTLNMYETWLMTYVGWGLAIDAPRMALWDDLFDVGRLQRFLSWHVKRVEGARVSQTGLHVVSVILLLAHHYERQERRQLQAFEKKLPMATPMHNKQSPMHQISAKELEDVALSLLAEAHAPYARAHPQSHNIRPGLNRACRHQTALLMRLMWRIPLRSRCIREMALGTNLYQSDQGQWFLRYVGEQLKVGERNGRVNEFHVPWPHELTEHLEEYLRDFRPYFPGATTDPHVFIARTGGELSKEALAYRLFAPVYHRLKKRIYPHLLRTLWVDQYLLASNGDVSTAAYLLNDNVTTVLKRYHELRGADHVKKAYAFNQAILGNGKTQTSKE